MKDIVLSTMIDFRNVHFFDTVKIAYSDCFWTWVNSFRNISAPFIYEKVKCKEDTCKLVISMF